MNELSPWTVYWIMQADSILAALNLLITLFAIITALCVLVVLLAMSEDAEIPKAFYRVPFISGLLFLLSLVAVSLFPSTKTLCTVYVVPAIVNNEQLAEDAGEIYTLGVERLKEALQE